MKMPNILFLMSDEHRFDVAGFAGNKIIKTPTLDSLAKDAVIFNNAYTPSPVCIPARQCMSSGKLPENCNCTIYGDDLAVGSETFAKKFSENGYHTCVSGKLHHFGLDQMQGWLQRIAPDCFITERFIENKNQAKFDEYKKNAPENSCHASGRGKNRWEIERAGIGCGVYQKFDIHAIDSAKDFIQEYFANPWYDRTLAHKPLFLKVSLLQPHYPFLADEDKFTYYMNRVEPYYEDTTDHVALKISQGQRGELNLSERDIRRATAAYYGMIEKIDEHFGEIINSLQAVGENIDDWIIVYTSDHGEMLGEHGVWEKMKFFEGSVRVPMFIRYPKLFGPKLIEKNVSLIDLYPTLCELCDIPYPDDLDGHSMIELLEGRTVNWENKVISSYKDMFMCKIDFLKYQYYTKFDSEILWDLEKDPKELINVIDDPKYKDIIEIFRIEREKLKGKYEKA